MKRYSRQKAVEELRSFTAVANPLVYEILVNFISPTPEWEKEDTTLKPKDEKLLSALNLLRENLIEVETILRQDF